jgi:hypothetical protein
LMYVHVYSFLLNVNIVYPMSPIKVGVPAFDTPDLEARKKEKANVPLRYTISGEL